MADCYAIRIRLCNWVSHQTTVCVQTRDDGYQQCTQTRDDGYQQCSRYEDQGYSTCGNWAQNCCDWWPCSWACDVVTAVCIAWVWISNVVCVAWTWVSNVICIASVWVPYIVCVAFLTMTEWMCVAVSWVVYWFCISAEAWHNFWLCIRLRFLVFWQCLRPRDAERNPLEKQGWNLIFTDDFTSGVIDPSKWTSMPYDGVTFYGSQFQAGNAPTQIFAPTFAFGPSTVKLIADNQPTQITNDPEFGNFAIPYKVGFLEWAAAQEQQYGYFEIRCKIPHTPEMWPAFWLVSRDAWPPEIDIFEFYTNDTNRFESTQWWGTEQNLHKQTGVHRVCRASEYFHIYACEWNASEIRWYYDNTLVRVASNGTSDFIYPMLVRINAAVDDRANHHPENSSYPSYFEVDYVRAYGP